MLYLLVLACGVGLGFWVAVRLHAGDEMRVRFVPCDCDGECTCGDDDV